MKEETSRVSRTLAQKKKKISFQSKMQIPQKGIQHPPISRGRWQITFSTNGPLPFLRKGTVFNSSLC